jgi:hypothetical protein
MLIAATFPGEEDVGCSSGNDSDVDSAGVIHIACNNQEYGWFYSNSEMAEQGRGVQIIAAPYQTGCCHEWTVSSLAADRREPGKLYFVIGGGDNRAYLVWRRQNSWSQPRLLTTVESEQSEKRAPPMITALPEGGAMVTWMERRGNTSDIYIARVNPSGELCRRKRIAAGNNPRFTLDEHGVVHIVYTRGGNLYYTRVPLADVPSTVGGNQEEP